MSNPLMQSAYDVPVRGGGLAFSKRVLATQPDHLIAYWPFWESAGPTAFDQSGNSYDLTPSATTWGEDGIGDGHTSAGFDGLLSLADMYSVGFVGDFNPAAGAFLFPFKVANAGVWTDGTQRRILRGTVDATNQMSVYRTTTNNQILVSMVNGGVSNSITVNGLTKTEFLIALLTWNTAANQLILYLDGVQAGITTCAGTWAGTFHSAKCLLGAYAATTQIFYGNFAHVAWWKNTLTPSEAAYLGAA